MRLRKYQRRLLLGLGLVGAGLAVLWLALPLWFPWALGPLARGKGARYARYERLGYGRFALHDLTFTNRSLRFHADRVEAYIPSSWLWRLRAGRRLEGSPFVQVTNWSFDTLPSTTTRAIETSTADEIKSIAGSLATVERWLPRAAMTNGAIRFPGETLAVASLTWSNGRLSAEVYSSQLEAETSVHATLERWPLTVELQSQSLNAATHLSVATNLTGIDLNATGSWLSNRMELEAHFGKNGTLPETVHLRAPDLRIPGLQFGLPIYEDLTGSLSANWATGRFELALDAHAHPLAARTNLPPVTLSIRARGDTNAVTVQTASVSSSWIEARLSPELNIHFTGPLLRQPALFEVTANLDALSGLALHGLLRGDAELVPTRRKLPSAQFRLSGSQVGHASLTANSLAVEGIFAWPSLRVTRAQAVLADGSIGTLFGDLDLQTNTVTNGNIELRGPFGQQWLPKAYSYDGLQLVAAFSGPLDALRHQGSLNVTNFVAPKLKPLQLRADWTGEQARLDRLNLLARAGNLSAQIDGALNWIRDQMQLKLVTVSLLTNEEPFLSLAQPCEITVRPPNTDRDLTVRTSPVTFNGPAGQIEAETELGWPHQGHVRLSIKELSSEPFTAFLRTNVPEMRIEKLTASADWSNNPVRLALDTSFSETSSNLAGSQPEQSPVRSTPAIPTSFAAQVRLASDENGLVISNLVVSTGTSAVFVVRGSLPLRFNPGDTNNFIIPILHQPCDLTAQAQPHAFFWQELGRWTGLEVQQPELRAHLSGTWDEPLGQVALRAQSLHFLANHTNLPVFKNLAFNVDISPRQVRLMEGHVLVQGQRIELTGQLPLDPDSWNGLLKMQPPDWARGRARMKIPAADLAAFEPLVPNILAPQGTLTADITLAPGGKLEGEVNIEGARTHPLGNFGSIRDIDVHLRFDQGALKLQSATASLSGAPLLLTGEVDLRGGEWLRGSIPPFHFTMRGSNVPLAREPEFIVRSDLDLAVDKTNEAPAVISGKAHLRDSYYLSDLRLLMPGKVTTPDRRPPFFSIDEPAVADWRLAVIVEGERFLKARTTLFNGAISASLKLDGTLRDPIALGDLKVDSGTVRFPFASLDVQQGLITLTSQDPYHPQISMTAASKQFGYDIHMLVSGSADAPIVQFSSTPPLSSEQILLMVTAGQLPQGTFNLTSQQRAETLALFLGRDLLAKLGIGEQGQQRLLLHSGEEITEQGKPTYRVEYKLSDRWSLVGEYDRFGDYNAGFKWRVYSK